VIGALTERPAVSILVYHQVGDFKAMRRHRANYCDRRRFTRQMALLARLGYRVLDLDTALDCLAGAQAAPARAVVLTFDDGYENFAQQALPVLQDHGFPATVYAISGWLGRRAEWFAAEPDRPIPDLMSAQRLREVHAAGITIGSHTASHTRLHRASRLVLRQELRDSKAALEDILGDEVRHLSYPYNSFDRATVHAAARAGYASATTCLRGLATVADHPLALPRLAISFGDRLLAYWWRLLIAPACAPALVQWRRHLADEPGHFRPLGADTGYGGPESSQDALPANERDQNPMPLSNESRTS
jgi:peptidoglycan/xylan/chitin deacetylase (PgdA/CDA1 family)